MTNPMFRPIHLSVLLTFLTLATGAGFYYQSKTENLVESTIAQTEVAPEKIERKILTKADFSGYGRSEKLRTDPKLSLQINPELAPLTLVIDSFVEPTTGAIKIYSDDGVNLIQKIELNDPNMRLADRIHENFNVTDINFDGYADIGVLVDGGAKWGAYQYWTFDKNTNQFVSTTLTDAFRKLNFNNFKLDTTNKQIKINNFEGMLMAFEDLYQVDNDQLTLLEEKYQEQIYDNNELVKKCVITTKKYLGKSVETSIETITDICAGY